MDYYLDDISNRLAEMKSALILKVTNDSDSFVVLKTKIKYGNTNFRWEKIKQSYPSTLVIKCIQESDFSPLFCSRIGTGLSELGILPTRMRIIGSVTNIKNWYHWEGGKLLVKKSYDISTTNYIIKVDSLESKLDKHLEKNGIKYDKPKPNRFENF